MSTFALAKLGDPGDQLIPPSHLPNGTRNVFYTFRSAERYTLLPEDEEWVVLVSDNNGRSWSIADVNDDEEG